MVKKVNHEEMGLLIKQYYDKKIALICYGSFGIGKSQVVNATAKEIAEKKKKEFVNWNRLTKEEKQKVYENPEKYFILMDIRLSEYDSSDIKGLPDFKDKDCIEWKSPFFAKVLEKENSDGILFFDEINLATPLVISSVYKIIYDRIINNSKINDNWLIMSAGNLSEDRAYTHDLSPPIRDRGGEIELVNSTSNEWVNWAIQNNIDNRIIGFLSFKPSCLHNVNFDDKQKFTTPRGWERVNNLIKEIKDLKTLDLVISTAISEGIAKEFIAFCKIQNDIDWESIIKNPEKIKKITEISTKYFIVTALVERYKEKKVKFEKIIEFTEILDEINNAEFVTLLWRLCYKYDKNRFKKDFVEGKINQKLKEKYANYLD